MATVKTPETNAGFFNGATDLAEYLVNQGKELQKAQHEAQANTMELNGVTFFWNRNNYRWEALRVPLITPEDAPVPAPYKFFTLNGLIEYITEDVEGLIKKDNKDRLILHVVDETTVKLMSHPAPNRKERHCIAECNAHVPRLKFDMWLDTETFNTMLLSNFVETEAREKVFMVTKNMVKEQTCNTTDDGVSQVITVKSGVSTASNVAFQNPVPLRPMRTFSEVDQPESNFTLRVNNDAKVCLTEADGGAWKNDAVNTIKEYLKQKLKGTNVVVIA